MKSTLKLLLTLSLLSGAALADNPSDAPLVSDNTKTAALPQSNPSDCGTKRTKEMNASASKGTSDARPKHAAARPNVITPVQSASSPTASPKFH